MKNIILILILILCGLGVVLSNMSNDNENFTLFCIAIVGYGSLLFFVTSLYFMQKYNIKTWSDFKKLKNNG